MTPNSAPGWLKFDIARMRLDEQVCPTLSVLNAVLASTECKISIDNIDPICGILPKPTRQELRAAALRLAEFGVVVRVGQNTFKAVVRDDVLCYGVRLCHARMNPPFNYWPAQPPCGSCKPLSAF